MIKHIRKLVFGKSEHNLVIKHSVLWQQKQNLLKVWENESHNDIGLERIFRLFLIGVQFFFPGIYIRNIISKWGLTYKNLAIECYVLAKLVYPLFILYFHQSHQIVFLSLSFYFLVETSTYIASLVFTPDIFYESRSVNRTILLLFLNYIEISFQFALLYSGFQMLTPNAVTGIDFIYFSFVTSASIGFGDIYPVTQAGKLLVCAQSFLLLIFVVLFFNYFSSKRIHPNK